MHVLRFNVHTLGYIDDKCGSLIGFLYLRIIAKRLSCNHASQQQRSFSIVTYTKSLLPIYKTVRSSGLLKLRVCHT